MTTTDAAALAATPRARHLYEIDVVRILTFACVIAVHTTSHTADAGDVPLYAFLGLVHFTREVFFWLTGFVLAYSWLARPVPLAKFWPRRFLLIGVPYVVWSTIYFVAEHLYAPGGSFWQNVGHYFFHLATGTAWYHLYFLLVTMQVYLLHPVIVWVVRKTERHHVAVLAMLFIYQLAITGIYFFDGALLGPISPNAKIFFFSYLFFIIGGYITAWHGAAFLAWVRAHRGTIGLVTLGTALLTLGWLAIVWTHGLSLYHGGTPLQPVEMVWSVGVGLGFLAVGTWWADRRNPDSRLARGVDWASDRSFGIFLSHPLVLWILLWIGGGFVPAVVPKPLLTLVCYVTVILVAGCIAQLARKTPLSLPLAGRPFRAKR